MQSLKVLLVVLAAFSTAACVSSINRQTAREMSDEVLCLQFGHWMRYPSAQSVAAVEAELTGRSIKPPSADEKNLILQGRVAIGMSECGMLAAMGGGGPYRKNSTVTQAGKMTQYVFPPYAGRAGSYVYADGGKVTAVQNY